MRYAGIDKNDMSAAPGISVSFYLQGCPIRCKGCHNPETWDFNGGKEFTNDTLTEIINALVDNNIERSLSVMGGEPLCEDNLFLTQLVITEVKRHLPNTKVYLWTGYYYDSLLKSANSRVSQILSMCDVLIAGPYIQELRDVTLPMRGSSNQEVINLK